MNTKGNFNSGKPVQPERRESRREQGASSLMHIGDFQATLWKGHWWERSCWQDPHPHAPPCTDQLNGDLTASKTKPNTGLGRLLSQNLGWKGHQMMMCAAETKSLSWQLLPCRRKRKGTNYWQWQQGVKEKGCKREVLLGLGRVQSIFPVDQNGLKQACAVVTLVLCSGGTQLWNILFLRCLQLCNCQSLWACLGPWTDWTLLVWRQSWGPGTQPSLNLVTGTETSFSPTVPHSEHASKSSA